MNIIWLAVVFQVPDVVGQTGLVPVLPFVVTFHVFFLVQLDSVASHVRLWVLPLVPLGRLVQLSQTLLCLLRFHWVFCIYDYLSVSCLSVSPPQGLIIFIVSRLRTARQNWKCFWDKQKAIGTIKCCYPEFQIFTHFLLNKKWFIRIWNIYLT